MSRSRAGLRLTDVRTIVALVKPRYHVSFVTVVVGALLFAELPDRALAGRLVMLYVSFNVLLYGGIYTFNDIADRAADSRHPVKRTRPSPVAANRSFQPPAPIPDTARSISQRAIVVSAGATKTHSPRSPRSNTVRVWNCTVRPPGPAVVPT